VTASRGQLNDPQSREAHMWRGITLPAESDADAAQELEKAGRSNRSHLGEAATRQNASQLMTEKLC